MKSSFCGVILFQVKPNSIDEFETLITTAIEQQKQQNGCISIKYMKRFYTFDEIGKPPRELTKIVKCVKYFAYWEFDNIDNYGTAVGWFFEHYRKQIEKLLIMPFDINSGYTLG